MTSRARATGSSQPVRVSVRVVSDMKPRVRLLYAAPNLDPFIGSMSAGLVPRWSFSEPNEDNNARGRRERCCAERPALRVPVTHRSGTARVRRPRPDGGSRF